MNVTLIGMAGAGKSHIGKRLAGYLDLKFLDIDTVMEEERGKPLEEILEEMGDEEFMRAEAHAIISATKGKDGLVFSPGGSAVYEDDAMRHLRDNSTIVYLKVPFEVIQKRIGGTKARMGRLVGLGKKTFRELYDERHPLYERYAHLTIDTEKLSAEGIIAAVSDFLNSRR